MKSFSLDFTVHSSGDRDPFHSISTASRLKSPSASAVAASSAAHAEIERTGLFPIDFDFAEHDLVRTGLAAGFGDVLGRAAAPCYVVDQEPDLRGRDRLGEMMLKDPALAEEAVHGCPSWRREDLVGLRGLLHMFER